MSGRARHVGSTGGSAPTQLLPEPAPAPRSKRGQQWRFPVLRWICPRGHLNRSSEARGGGGFYCRECVRFYWHTDIEAVFLIRWLAGQAYPHNTDA